MSSLDDSLASDPGDSARETLRKDVAEMVLLRVTEWNGIKLHESAFTPAPSAPTQQSISPEQARAKELAERQRIAMAASGGPVRRLSGTGST